MSTFGGIYFTNKGRSLQAKALTGADLNFTRIAVGDGSLSGQAVEDLSALIHEVKTLEINKLRTGQSGKVTIGGILSNQDITSGFYWRELGLFAQDPDLGEILYCYGNAGNLAEYIPSPSGSDILEKQIDIVAIVGNAANVSAIIDSSLVYASASDLADSLNEAKSYTDSKVPTKTSQLQNDSGFITSSAIPSSLPANGGNAATVNSHTASVTPGTTEKTDIIGMVNEVNSSLASHKADYVRQPGYGTDSGSANACAVTLSPAPTSYADGMGVAIKIANANTGASTINVNGLGVKTIKNPDGTDLALGDLKAGGIYSLKYNSTTGNFILVGKGGVIGKVPNLIKNGSFSNDTNGWTLSSSPTLSVVSGVLNMTAIASGSGISQSFGAKLSHIIYACLKQKSYTAISTYFNIYEATGSGNIDHPITLTTGASLTFASIRFITAANNTNLIATLVDWNTSGWGTIQADDIMLIDLTDAFGTGKEPSQATMDSLVNIFGGWWDSDLASLTFDATIPDGSWILSPATAYKNGVKLTGTMGDHRFAATGGAYTTASSVKTDGIGNLCIAPPWGFYTDEVNAGGFGEIVVFDPDFIASNILSGKNIFGLVGTLDALPTVNAGGNIVMTEPGPAYINPSDNAVYGKKLMEIKLNNVKGTIRVTFTAQQNNQVAGGTKMKVYINGVVRGTERYGANGTNTNPVTYSEDFTVNKNDLVQLYGYAINSSYSATITNFTLGIDNSLCQINL